MIEVVEVGGSVLVEDLGRPGRSHLGVSPSGAADRGALTAANRALGNPAGAAALEITGGATFRVHADLILAVTGAVAEVSVDGVPIDEALLPVLAVPARGVVTLAAPRWGLRSYLAVAGGLGLPEVLGSRSTDVLSGLGPAPLRAGDRIAVLPMSGGLPTRDPERRRPPSGTLVMLDATPGPRRDWLVDPAALYERPWRVTALADRVGTRLEGEPLVRAVTDELPSEGVVAGSVQVPPNGQPVILGPDHPVTGGYPVVAVLTAAACDVLAQLRPGTTVRFRHAHPRD